MTGHPYPRFSGPRIGYSSILGFLAVFMLLLKIISRHFSNIFYMCLNKILSRSMGESQTIHRKNQWITEHEKNIP